MKEFLVIAEVKKKNTRGKKDKRSKSNDKHTKQAMYTAIVVSKEFEAIKKKVN